MKASEAVEFLKYIKSGQLALEQAANYLLTLEATEANKRLRAAVTELIAISITDLELPVVSEHPELNVYK